MHTLEIVLGEWISSGVKLDGESLPVESILVDVTVGKATRVSLVGVERERFEENFPEWVELIRPYVEFPGESMLWPDSLAINGKDLSLAYFDVRVVWGPGVAGSGRVFPERVVDGRIRWAGV